MPIVAMLLRATQGRAAATIISLMLSGCFINGLSASITSASRLVIAMARDGGIIFHSFFEHIATRLNVPVRAILFCYVFNVCFGLLYLVPQVAFSAYVASLVVLLSLSYAAPTIIVLVRGRQLLKPYQMTNAFRPRSPFDELMSYVYVTFLIITLILRLFELSLRQKTDLAQLFLFSCGIPSDEG